MESSFSDRTVAGEYCLGIAVLHVDVCHCECTCLTTECEPFTRKMYETHRLSSFFLDCKSIMQAGMLSD